MQAFRGHRWHSLSLQSSLCFFTTSLHLGISFSEPCQLYRTSASDCWATLKPVLWKPFHRPRKRVSISKKPSEDPNQKPPKKLFFFTHTWDPPWQKKKSASTCKIRKDRLQKYPKRRSHQETECCVRGKSALTAAMAPAVDLLLLLLAPLPLPFLFVAAPVTTQNCALAPVNASVADLNKGYFTNWPLSQVHLLPLSPRCVSVYMLPTTSVCVGICGIIFVCVTFSQNSWVFLIFCFPDLLMWFLFFLLWRPLGVL